MGKKIINKKENRGGGIKGVHGRKPTGYGPFKSMTIPVRYELKMKEHLEYLKGLEVDYASGIRLSLEEAKRQA